MHVKRTRIVTGRTCDHSFIVQNTFTHIRKMPRKIHLSKTILAACVTTTRSTGNQRQPTSTDMPLRIQCMIILQTKA